MERDNLYKYLNVEHLSTQHILLGMFNHFNNKYQAKADTVFTEISWRQMFFLNVIKLHKTPPTIQEVADFLGCSHQNTSKLFNKMLKMGYVEAMTDEKDKRKQRLFLTKKAQMFFEKVESKGTSRVDEIFGVLSKDELEQMINFMEKLIVKVEQASL